MARVSMGTLAVLQRSKLPIHNPKQQAKEASGVGETKAEDCVAEARRSLIEMDEDATIRCRRGEVERGQERGVPFPRWRWFLRCGPETQTSPAIEQKANAYPLRRFRKERSVEEVVVSRGNERKVQQGLCRKKER